MVKIDIDAKCELEWNSQILTGTYKAIGGLGDYAFYENQTPDANGNWWYFYFDIASNAWRFSFAGGTKAISPFMSERPLVPGDSFSETAISPFNESEQIQFDLATHKFSSIDIETTCEISVDDQRKFYFFERSIIWLLMSDKNYMNIVMKMANKINIDTQCENDWNNQTIPGTYQTIGGFGDYTIYKKQTPDANGWWQYLYFDATSNGWSFGWSADTFGPGDTFLETVISPFDNERTGQSSNLIINIIYLE